MICVQQLVRLREKSDEIRAAGGVLIAISVDTPEQSKQLQDRLKEEGTPLDFPLVCDPTGKAIQSFGVWDHAHDVALPSVVILDRTNKVAWKYVGETILDRPEEAHMISKLQELSGKS